jgi:uncharacterized protein
LLDVNVLIALAWPNHVHHERAHEWFGGPERGPWATCPLTQSGFVRVSSQPHVIPDARTPRQAIELLRSIVALPGHVFWEDDVAMSRPEPIDPDRIVGHRQVTDAHLLALAIRRGGRLATFDRGVQELAGDRRAAVDVIL